VNAWHPGFDPGADPFPPRWYGRPEPDFESPEWKDAAGWLMAHCPPGMKMRYYETRLKFGGFTSAPLWHLEFSLPGSENLHVADAVLTLLNPAVTLVELEREFRFGDPRQAKFYTPAGAAPVPREDPASKPSRPESPLGAEFQPGKRYAAAGDAARVGERYTDPQRGVWEKKSRAQLGGAVSVWWEKVG